MGGNGHAVDHNKATAHPLVLKMGTVKADGTGDCYCYACNENALDKELSKHLAHFGISVTGAEKTVKSTAEIELEKSMSLNLSAVSHQSFRRPFCCSLQ